MKKAKDTTAPKASFAAGLIMAPRPLDCIHVPVMNAAWSAQLPKFRELPLFGELAATPFLCRPSLVRRQVTEKDVQRVGLFRFVLLSGNRGQVHRWLCT